MSTSDADRQAAPRRDPHPTAVQKWITRGIFGVAAIGVLAAAILWVLRDGKGGSGDLQPSLVAGVAGFLGTLAGALGSLATAGGRAGIAAARAEREAVGESRVRLVQAEGALAAALRSGESDTRPRHNLFPNINVDGDPSPSLADSEGEARRRALGLPELWETTHARLDLYHNIATGQARTSFRNAQVSMGVGFLLLVFFVILALNASTTAGAIVAGGLGAVSAALAGYVSRTFIRSQEAAATHLRSYFDQPLELSRFLAAERLISDGDLSQEQRGEILSALVQAMVTGPPQPLAPSSVVVASVPGQQGAA